MAKRTFIVGGGRFGSSLATRLSELGCEVVVADDEGAFGHGGRSGISRGYVVRVGCELARTVPSERHPDGATKVAPYN